MKMRPPLGPRYKLPGRATAPELLAQMVPVRRTAKINVRLPASLLDRVRALAAEAGDSISQFVERAICQEIQRVANDRGKR